MLQNIDKTNTNINTDVNDVATNNIVTTSLSAFSLIELSIVLVILGLLILGVVKASNMISASKIVNITRELNNYVVATETFQAKYGNLPGILEDPQSKLGPKAKSKIDKNKSNDYLINESGEVTNAESLNFFQHLCLAGLLDNDYVGSNEQLNTRAEIREGNYYPTIKGLRELFVYVRGDDIDGSYNQINRLAVENYGSSTGGIDASVLVSLDNKIDDGLPLSGSLTIVPTVLEDNTSSTTSED